MKNKPLFSVVIPAYNHDKYIRATIKSVLNQTLEAFELIIVNDGSTDKTEEIIKSFNDERIKYFYQENHDAPYTINRGLKMAKGKYIAILNSDDLFEKDKLEKSLKGLENGADFVYGKLKAIDQENKPMEKEDERVIWIDKRLNNSDEPNTIEKLVKNINYFVTTSNYVFKREVVDIVGFFNEKLHISHDFDYLIRIWESGFNIEFMPEYLGSYRMHSDNTISKGRDLAYLEPAYSLARSVRKNSKLRESILEAVLTQPIFASAVSFFLSLSDDEMDKVVNDKENINRKKLLDQINQSLVGTKFLDYSILQLCNTNNVQMTISQQNNSIKELQGELDAMRSTIRWKISNFLYKKTKKILSSLGCMIYGKENKKRKEIEKITNHSLLNNKVSINNLEDKISVVMLTLNRVEDTKMSVHALYKYIPFSFELIILDNGSDEKMLEYLNHLQHSKKNVKIVLEKENLGCAGGRKKAFKMAKNKYIFSIDNDIIITSFVVENLIETITSNSGAVGACCKSVFPNGKIQFNGGDIEVKERFIKFILVNEGKRYDDNKTLKQNECKWIPGGATMWKREIFNEIEIDDEMKGSYEDNDFSLVLRNAGYKIYNCPKAVVIHNHIYFNSKAKKEKKYMKNRYNRENILNAMVRFYKKHNLIIQDGFLAQFGLDVDNSRQVEEFFKNKLYYERTNEVTVNTGNNEKLKKFAGVFGNEETVFLKNISEKEYDEKKVLKLWDILNRIEKPKALDELQKNNFLGIFIDILYKNNRYEEIFFFSDVIFSNEIKSENNKKIAFYINKLYNGGREKVVQLLANDFVEKGWVVVIVTSEAEHINDYKLDNRINRIVLPDNQSMALGYLIDKLNELSIGIFASHNWLDEKEMLMFTYLRENGIKVCLSDHIGLRERTIVNKSLGAIRDVVNSDNIINGLTCLSKLETMVWRKFGQDVAFMPNPIEILGENSQHNKKHNQIIWVGRLEREQKQPEQAIRAFSALLNEKKDASLIIVGSDNGIKLGKYHKELKSLCRKLGCESRVSFIGFSENVSKFLRESSIHWLTSSYEGFPMVWVEAKISGTPTVLYDMPWVELNGKGSVTVDQGDYKSLAKETLKLLKDEELLLKLSEEAKYDLLKRFNPMDVINRWEKFYLDLLTKNKTDFFNEKFENLDESEKKYFRIYINNIIDQISVAKTSDIRKESSIIMNVESPSELKSKLKFVIFHPQKFLKKYLRIYLS